MSSYSTTKEDDRKKKVTEREPIKKVCPKFIAKHAMENSIPSLEEPNNWNKVSTSFNFACENVTDNIAQAFLGNIFEPVLQPVDANEPVVCDLTSAENIPKENSIADKQITYAIPELRMVQQIILISKGDLGTLWL